MKSRVVATTILILTASIFSGCGEQSRVSSSTPAAGTKAEQKQAPAQPAEGAALQVVEAKYVCMINNQRFSKTQIPVEVEGRTYYGCCDMCKEKLGGDPKSRVATDPVSGKEVDKSKAVIGVDADGAAFYFESAENLKRYKPASRS